MTTATAAPPRQAQPAGAPGGKLFPTRHDLPADARARLVAVLNQQLADTIDLYTQVKYAHWNVKGPTFIALHKLFDEFADGLTEFVDLLGERVTALGGVALGTARMAAGTSRLPEFPADAVAGAAVVPALADRYAALSKSTREAAEAATQLGDPDTAGVLGQISPDLDKALYFLEAHLQG